jgi:heat shock protein HslJ
VIGAAALAGCGDDGDEGSSGADPFGSTTWVLEAGTVDGDALALVADAPVTLTVDEGTLAGTSACNRYSGPLTVDGDSVELGPGLAVTEMACLDPGVTELEAAYLAAIVRVDTVDREDDRLVLTGEGVELTFSAQPVEPDAPLVGTTWVLTTIIDGDVAMSVLGDPTLEFADDGSVSGSTGCNRLMGSYDPATGFGPMATTMMACEPDLADQETRVLAVFDGDPDVVVEGATLTLTLATADGAELIYEAG